MRQESKLDRSTTLAACVLCCLPLTTDFRRAQILSADRVWRGSIVSRSASLVAL